MSEMHTGSELIESARMQDAALIASLRGEIDLHNSPELRQRLMELLDKHQPRKLVLNLSQVPYMDSSAVAVLVECLQKLRKQDGNLYLTHLQPRVRGLLEIARLDSIFVLVDDEQAALGGKQQDGRGPS